MVTTYGRKGGEGPTRDKTASVYEVTLPPQLGGRTIRKKSFKLTADTAIATGFNSNITGKPLIVVWPDAPAWEGTFGRLTARRVA